ncbi:MAG: response regulator transcription factor [Tissierellales bacterium]|nr:response regulator transcription factor [Tissierellales bacterium]MBN2827861.1 response regulator transcription factor [Tissierellales bacterium]
MKILIVEDEVKLTEALSFLFKKQKIDVEIANDGEEGMIMAQKDIYDVIVLDIMLPIINGLDILKKIRDKGVKTPVLLLTAKDTIDDKVTGLDSGADDYLVKPFATKELIARVKALSRRKDVPFISHGIKFNDIVYDPDSFELTVRETSVKIPKKEGDLMELLITRPNQVFTRDQIVDRLWGLESDVLENNIEIYIHHLRKRLEESDTKIETIRGVGYILKEK